MEDNPVGLTSISGLLDQYAELLPSVPNHVPLMAPKGKKEQLFQKQILEAFLYQEWIAPFKSIADIGTGSGFPGITLAIVNPTKQFYLVDKRLNSILFLDKVIQTLRLKNVITLCLPGEQLNTQKWRVQAVVARAVSRIGNLLSWSEPILERQGLLILGKGQHCEKEIQNTISDTYTLLHQVSQLLALWLFTKNVKSLLLP